MKRFQIKALIVIFVIALFMGTLIVLTTGVLETPKHIDGIEELGITFDELKIPEGVKVVGIGEATHGNSEFQTAKLNMLKKLVNEGTCHAIAFEMSPAEAALYNDAIRENESDLTELIGGTDYPLYDTKEMVELLTWMREYNLSHDESESVMFYGVDMQTGFRAVKYLNDFCEKNRDFFDGVEPDVLNALAQDENCDIRAYRDFFNDLSAKLATKDDVFFKDASIVAKSLVQWCDAPSFEENSNDYSIHRDTCMAENLKAFYDIEVSRGYPQIIITAHNGHTMKVRTPGSESINMGRKIDEIFEGSYFCVGTGFYNACVNIHTMGTFDDEYERANHDFCSSDLLAYQAQFFDGGVYCLDFSQITDTKSKVYKIIHNMNFTGEAGEGYNEQWEIYKSYRSKIVAVDHFDAMVYYYEATPIDPIHY